jgi:hypothetical protein
LFNGCLIVSGTGCSLPICRTGFGLMGGRLLSAERGPRGTMRACRSLSSTGPSAALTWFSSSPHSCAGNLFPFRSPDVCRRKRSRPRESRACRSAPPEYRDRLRAFSELPQERRFGRSDLGLYSSEAPQTGDMCLGLLGCIWCVIARWAAARRLPARPSRSRSMRSSSSPPFSFTVHSKSRLRITNHGPGDPTGDAAGSTSAITTLYSS